MNVHERIDSALSPEHLRGTFRGWAYEQLWLLATLAGSLTTICLGIRIITQHDPQPSWRAGIAAVAFLVAFAASFAWVEVSSSVEIAEEAPLNRVLGYVVATALVVAAAIIMIALKMIVGL